MTLPDNTKKASLVRQALWRSKGVFISVALFSGFVNVLALAGAFYMLQVYDRILPSESVPTLIALTVLLVGLYLIYGMLDVVRVRIMARVGVRFAQALREPVYNALQKIALQSGDDKIRAQPVRDLDQIRNFLSGLGPTAFFDLPWMPVYLCVVYLMHPVLGGFALLGAIVLVLIALAAELKSAKPSRSAIESGLKRQEFGDATSANAEAVHAMGFAGNLYGRWRDLNDQVVGAQLQASDAISGFGTISKVIRLLLQSGILGIGAYLVILDQLTAGAMIAASIITSRALAPIESTIAHWRGFIAARESYRRLKELLNLLDSEETETLSLPAPKSSVSVQALSVAPPGTRVPIIRNINFDLKAGDAMGIIGPSASGKSTLVRALVGIWQPVTMGGSVRIDGASLDQWSLTERGQHIGYVPQDVNLLKGTIAENISRFDEQADGHDIITAAQAAGVHDMIVHMPDGYQTSVGENGRSLSAGQRQRIALARALYRDPFLVVLDEPNSNLDALGEAGLVKAIRSVRKRGGIVIIVAHRPSALSEINVALALVDGRVAAYGPKDEVLQKFTRTA